MFGWMKGKSYSKEEKEQRDNIDLNIKAVCCLPDAKNTENFNKLVQHLKAECEKRNKYLLHYEERPSKAQSTPSRRSSRTRRSTHHRSTSPCR